MRFMRDLSPETQRVLRRCDQESQHHRVRQRAHGMLLRCDGRTPKELRPLCDVERLTISHWFAAWERRRCAGLSDHTGRGRPPKLTEAAQEQAPQSSAHHPQHMQKVVHLIAQETSTRVSPKTIKRLRKKTALSGNGSSTPQRSVQSLRNRSAAQP